MSFFVQGLKSKSEEYEKRIMIYKYCKEMNISIPKEIDEYFVGEVCDCGIVVDLPESALERSEDKYNDFLEIDLSKIPKGVDKIWILRPVIR